MNDALAAPSRSPALLYDGKISELYRIFLLNILFTILTVGIFRFWAITRYRRYIWSRMRFQGERFEYTGTGGQLFVGYLLAGLILVGAGVVAGATSFVLRLVWPPLAFIPFLLLYLFVGVLAAGAVFSAQRYRLSRTLWCGIHGGMTGSMFRYGMRAICYGFLVLITLLQLVPWMQVRLAERRINASSFGNVPFSFHGRARQLYVAYLLTFVGSVVLFAIVGSTVWSVAKATDLALLSAPLPSDANAKALLMQRLIWTVFAGLIIFGILSGLVRSWYAAMFERHVAGNSTLGTVRFASSMTGRALFGLMLGNMLILVFTLGLGYPIVLQRNSRILAHTLQAEGSLEASALRQSSLSGPRFGEGMFQQLDAGGVL